MFCSSEKTRALSASERARSTDLGFTTKLWRNESKLLQKSKSLLKDQRGGSAAGVYQQGIKVDQTMDDVEEEQRTKFVIYQIWFIIRFIKYECLI